MLNFVKQKNTTSGIAFCKTKKNKHFFDESDSPKIEGSKLFYGVFEAGLYVT